MKMQLARKVTDWLGYNVAADVIKLVDDQVQSITGNIHHQELECLTNIREAESHINIDVQSNESMCTHLQIGQLHLAQGG